jgi:energy-coupling factor transport system substrate-specific component
MLLFSGAEESNNRAFLSGYVQTLYGEESAIPMGIINSILQTSDGYMWFAGYRGLMRYNGTETMLMTPEDGLPSFSINLLFEDSSNRMWVCTNDSGIAVYERGVFTVYGLEEGLPSASVRGITENEAGTMYIATTGGIAVITPDGALSVHPQLGDVFAMYIVYVGGGRFLTLLNDGRIILFDEQKTIKEFTADDFDDVPYSMCLVGNELYIGTRGNDFYIADVELSSRRAITTPLSSYNYFYKDSAGRIWATADNGAGYFQNNAFNLVDGLIMSNRIECIFEDYEGNFWLGSSRSGLLQLSRSKLTNISFLASLPPALVVNTTSLWNGDLYIGTDSGLIILRNYMQIENELTEMLDGIRIRGIFTDTKNQMWICTWEKFGVILVKPDGTFVSITDEDGLASNRTRCFTEAPNGDIYIGMNGGISVIRGEQVIKSYTKDDGLANDVILSLCADKDGNIIAGSDGGGIYVMNSSGITVNYTENDGLTAGIILRVTPGDDGVWISTGNALHLMDDSGIRVIEKLELRDDNLFDIKIIRDEIWLLRSRSISICKTDNLLSDDELIVKNLQRRDGLSSTITANSWNALAGDGMLYISASIGVFRINTLDIPQNEIIPIAKISGVYADSTRVPENENGVIEIKSDTQRLDIFISLLSFSSREGTVSYMLEGFDSEIITASRNDISHISYTNLSGGQYTFRLFGTNADGFQSETVILTIEKEYTLLEMPFVRLLLVLLGAGAVLLSVRILISQRTRTLIKQRQEYKETTGQIINVAAEMADFKNELMKGHSRRVAAYSKMVGQRLALEDHELETLYYAALLHDIGKAGIPDSIMNKAAPLTEDEYEIVKTHTVKGNNLIGNITVLGDIAFGAKYHHERIDGKGYPEGLSRDEIPLTARIICVCSAFDSMLSEQPYRKALTLEKAQSELISNAGKQFDERVTAVLVSLISEGEVPICN